MKALRWGRSAYHTDADLALEREVAAGCGLGWVAAPDRKRLPDLAGIDVLVVDSGVRVDAAVLGTFEGRLVVTTTSGTDHIDLAAARARSVDVARLPEARREAVIHHSLAGMIGLMRGFPTLFAAAGRGRWARGDLPALAPVALDGATVAVVGLGVIGARMAEVLPLLGVRVLGVDPRRPDAVPLAEALPRADAVTVHCSLTPSSRGLFSAETLAWMPPHAVLVNTARGPIVDVPAAVARVRSGSLRGLLVDVFPEEPWPALADGAQVPGVWFTPHAAGFTRDLGARVADGLARVLGAFVRGEPVPWRVHAEDRLREP